jgi:hypothetical protein
MATDRRAEFNEGDRVRVKGTVRTGELRGPLTGYDRPRWLVAYDEAIVGTRAMGRDYDERDLELI